MDGKIKVVKKSPKSSPFKKNMCFKSSKYKSFSGCAKYQYRRDKNVLVKKRQKTSQLHLKNYQKTQ